MNNLSINSGRKIAGAIVVPMVIIVVISVFGIFGVMYWSAHLSDRNAEQSQHTLIAGAMQLSQNYLVKQQTGVVIWEEAYHVVNQPTPNESWIYNNMTHWLYQNHGFTKSILFDRECDVMNLYARDHTRTWATEDLMDDLQPAVAKVRARYISSMKKTPSGLYRFAPEYSDTRRSIAETGVVSIGGRPHLFTAAAVVPQILSISKNRRPPVTLVSLVPLEGEKLNDIAEMSRLNGFVLTDSPTTRAGAGRYLLHSPRGRNIGAIGWNTKLPGSQMLNRITPFLALAAFMITMVVIAVIIFTRQMTKRLARSEAKAVHTARHDALSGLPNRTSFHALLTDSLQKGTGTSRNTAVVYIDLDHFKDINDTLGHSAGDMVIVAVAQRLKRVIPDTGIVARISGDEFAMVIRDCESDEWLEYILDQVQDEIGRPIMIGRRELFASLSMGVAVAPRDGDDPDELLRKADIALYDAKANGRSRRSFFEAHMEHHVQSRDRMSRELRLALQNDELDLAYQPQCDTGGRRIVSVEVLARWTKDDGTVVSPSQFIPVAEETGLINELGIWVLNKACAKAHDWPGMIVAVNVSPNQFKHPRFVEKVMAILAANNLPPQRLEIEVTESVFAGRNDSVLKALRRLKNLGVKVALDDFGSGYSSLSYLRRFPFDTLKIDRDFLSGMNGNAEAEAILVSIIQLGKALGMTIVAEGIETVEQLRFLQMHECHRMQGYYISRPLSDAGLAEFLTEFNGDSTGGFGTDFSYQPRKAGMIF
ncbi:bifunctional diguanylate cyclase/phosphodiesterase [Labrenzia sp. 011]|uniref:bifunctional diguanylate cyclase/phosphodiesterase n=1 Tax=Labrenzia sp. 011 TaxID=2171494 RepID=UPI000D50903B|nr:bifunctional diguanylate cyclase/phosphodiesterase [Labrenzia sp. 011]PVB61097.1 bifunctional diguanylate cyclase/phosphodiesterase [Labrenzia sp. 011]